MYDVVLIYPPTKFSETSKRGPMYGLPPLGGLYLSAYLNQQGIKTIVIDAAKHHLSLDETIAWIMRHNPKLVGISGMTVHFKSIKKLCDALREITRSLKIVLGGPHFSATAGEALTYIESADFIIGGEAEEALHQLVLATENRNYHDVSGLSYRSNGTVLSNPVMPLSVSLDNLPFPNLKHLEPPTTYCVRYGRYDAVMSLMASRGCPFRCTFCDVYITQGRKLRLRSPQSILDEIFFNMDSFGIREFVFKDSTFTINKKWVNELLDLMIAEKLNISWSINTRVDMITDEMLRKLKAAGCRKISFGVESGDQRVLDKIQKGITLDQIRQAFDLVRKVGIETHAFFMIGNPGETRDTAEKTICFSKQLNPTWAAFAPTVVYPGTQMYHEATTNGLLQNPLWYLEDTTEVFMSNIGSVCKGQMLLPHFSPEEQLRYVKKAYRDFYFRAAWVFSLITTINLSSASATNLLKSIPTFLSFVKKRKNE
jgi:anaerobic magnesium-protoporphyrin IX monomethyl ester cyclase